jgi:hypothetical protein
MAFVLIDACVAGICSLIVLWSKRKTERNKMEQHSITPEALHVMLASNQEVLLFDVRQPLDLLPILKLSLVHKEFRQIRT